MYQARVSAWNMYRVEKCYGDFINKVTFIFFDTVRIYFFVILCRQKEGVISSAFNGIRKCIKEREKSWAYSSPDELDLIKKHMELSLHYGLF